MATVNRFDRLARARTAQKVDRRQSRFSPSYNSLLSLLSAVSSCRSFPSSSIRSSISRRLSLDKWRGSGSQTEKVGPCSSRRGFLWKTLCAFQARARRREVTKRQSTGAFFHQSTALGYARRSFFAHPDPARISCSRSLRKCCHSGRGCRARGRTLPSPREDARSRGQAHFGG